MMGKQKHGSVLGSLRVRTNCLSFKIFSVGKPPYLIFMCSNKYNRVVVTQKKKKKSDFELLDSTYD